MPKRGKQYRPAKVHKAKRSNDVVIPPELLKRWAEAVADCHEPMPTLVELAIKHAALVGK